MNIVLFGPPGAGKGTQSEKIEKKFKYFKVSTGDLLREEIKKKNTLGNTVKDLVENGLFVSDEIVSKLVEKIISNPLYKNKLIFDGYPRNVNQAQNLKVLLNKYKQKISGAFILKVDKNNLIKRILGRQVCTKCGSTFNEFFNPSNVKNHTCGNSFLIKRMDDNEKTLRARFDTYEKQTLPILMFYKEQKILHEIDGMREIDEIYRQISTIITSLET